MIYGYARVSTQSQASDGYSLDSQVSTLKAYGAQAIYKDVFTGTKADRPELTKLLSILEPNDTIIVTKLDRLSRSVTDGSKLVSDLINNNISVRVLNMGLIENTPTGRLMCSVLFAMAEFERDMIVERTQEGKRIAKLDPDYTEGRPRIELDQDELKRAYKKVSAGELTYTKAAKYFDISPRTLKRRFSELVCGV